ncbi:MAG: Na/Pi cotransporter family protein [Hyphomicrobiaceae bacterium]
MSTLINLVGSVALLIWGVRLVRTGIMRSFGSEMRWLLAAAGGRRVLAMLSGMAITTLLQSSMATALLVSSFAARSAISGATAIAAILGADVGSTLVVQLFSQRVHWIGPLFIGIGVFAFLWSTRSWMRGLSRAVLGVGLIMLSLTLISEAAAPLAQTQGVASTIRIVTSDHVLTLVLAVLATLALHSSVAVILTTAAFATSGVITLGAGLVIVLGANIGSAILPLLSLMTAPLVVRRSLLANVAIRTVGALAMLPLVIVTADALATTGISGGQLMANAHMVFNLALVAVVLPFVEAIDRLLTRLMPESSGGELTQVASHLDESALSTPALALACASREALRIGDTVHSMLRSTIDVFRSNDADLRGRIEAEDDAVDRHYEATKLYLARLTREELDREEGDRSIEIISFTTNLEHIGDIIDKNLMELAGKKIRTRASFSEAGMRELEAFHSRVVSNMELALNVFVSGDLAMARQLLRQKTEIRDLERRSIERHFERIGAGDSQSLDTSSLHLDVLRDLKRINSHLTAVAYPILERAGELAETRLRSGGQEVLRGPAPSDRAPAAREDNQ